MSVKIGLVGYQGSGKSTLFEWLTGVQPDPAHAHESQAAMATAPAPRVEPLCKIYNPKKVTRASMEIVDTPGLGRSHESSAQKLAQIREAGCLVIVVAAFAGNDPAADLTSLEDDLLLADLEIVSGRVERLRESVKKPRPNRDEQIQELAALEPVLEALEGGKAIWHLELTPEQERATRSFQLFSSKPRLIIINTADDEENLERFQDIAPSNTRLVAASLLLQTELAKMESSERDDFCAEMGVAPLDRDPLLDIIMEVSGQMLFFTAGESEVRTWMIRKGGTAVEAAGNIHTDLARGFIRAETMNCDDLIRLGSEREIKAHSLLRHEHKDYVIQEGDILLIRHN